ncbi:formate--tetrahydrofolate ligase [Bartonella tribocorum]|uniref:Formate--tetrahydrofolate ligase n=1 Tax=Bartonella tribocorum (strain DSM 28219 / CCUG 45778 / CIP 105476 / IBS 506) TaxID=382640 RepID=FTHS_BART1|nr:formate--tetrahydrofolate ligase [Bartonella tribocorum]A9IM41.1 RecName: Full=Formate--tetrahydrofolate ligase; AltName: Full=Formyltetrahydrofolate synthetase; Short=FHS; Short=FTHFS [Bartonella tribocorum CIP 105476]CAK00634.1 formate--tetrahydrofolate ligase [Bartonella tribocorum CIP 105476]CDO47824.1 formate-tetrahydrofolate ligase [Bartonella tribocorum]
MHKTDIEIAHTAKKQHITEIAQKIGIAHENLIPYGHDKAKISSSYIKSLNNNPDGKLILVTAINPTPAGEGKTTTTVGLSDALNLIGKKTIATLREPSLGPCFGVKGGAAGGGYAQVIPMDDLNLHFTGDFHAITAAHNLLAAMIDNHIYWGNPLNIDPRRIVWKRVLDMNDRALRDIVISLGGITNGFPRQTGFDITVASEIMALLCLSENLENLTQRLKKIIVAYRHDKTPVTVADLNAEGAMAVLLKDAIQPNLVQTIENNPVLVHGGPFANIAHGCNSVIATKTALKLADYVVTEAGFGADLGAEKFFNIKCRQTGIVPNATVIVATIRALKMNGGVDKNNLTEENITALEKGAANLVRHIKNMALYGIPCVVAINHFDSDSDAEIRTLQKIVATTGHKALICKHWEQGGKGAVALAQELVTLIEKQDSDFKVLYQDDIPLVQKINCIITKLYGGRGAIISATILKQLESWEKEGFGTYPICMAKTPYSFSADPKQYGAPVDFEIPVREVRLCAGAGFIVVICGDVMTMPGLPHYPAAEKIHLDENDQIQGLS